MRRQCFQDFDAFANSISGVESKMLLRNPQHRTWILNLVDLLGAPVQSARLGSGNIARGELRADGELLYLPLTDGCEYNANGAVIEKDSFAILDPGCEFCISTRVEHDWCSVTLPADFGARDKDLVEPSSRAGQAIVRITRPNRRLASQFREMVRQVMSVADEYPQFESTPAAKSARAELLKVASLVAGQQPVSAPNQEGRPRLSREVIIGRVEEFLEQRDGERVLVEDLAAAADVSERTLRTAFNDYFGVGPVRFLQLRQLHRVHRALRAADTEAVSVSHVLVAHGEWEFSRFAARYRRQFGELPSTTLRAKQC